MGGPAPSVPVVDKKLVPHPVEAPIAACHELFVDTSACARSRGCSTKRSQQARQDISASGVEIMLRDTTPKGLHLANYKQWDRRPSAGDASRSSSGFTSRWNHRSGERGRLRRHFQDTHDNRKPPPKAPCSFSPGFFSVTAGPDVCQIEYAEVCLPQVPQQDPDRGLGCNLSSRSKDYMLSPEELAAYLRSKDDDSRPRRNFWRRRARGKNLRGEMDKLSASS